MGHKKVVIFILGGLFFGLAGKQLVSFLVELSDQAGLNFALRDYLTALVTSIAVAIAIVFLPFSNYAKRHIFILWGLRCMVTLGFMLVYERHYIQLDAFTFFRKAELGLYLPQWSLMDGTNNVIRLMGMMMEAFPILKSYHAMKVIWSLFGFIGGYCIWRSYVLASGEENLKVLWLVCGMPSIMFWSSILGKDPIVYMGIGMASWGGVGLFRNMNAKYFCLLLAGLICIAEIRLWMALCVLLALGVAFLNVSSKEFNFSGPIKIATWVAFFFFGGLFVERFKIGSQTEMLEKINTISRGWSMGGSYQEVPELTSAWEIAKFLPLGVFTALFRPLPGEVSNLFGWLAGIENMILIFSVFQIFSLVRKKDLNEHAIQFFFVLIVSWSLIYSVISYQNLGTAVRFKIQVLPFIILLPYYLRARIQQDEDKKRIWIKDSSSSLQDS